ncbi:AB-hydrolase YheT [Sistotremastrum niveocremeum HHB9708]|uniref:AB-hydrolase YheT n=2 Tax=Sistotremastraceae TaxID=3402574 RepID=A0A164QRB2_9AGAM|nr:AB-hydrolase YheT [Sistotremastrum niveocremeum HHB9708]KZT32657.1 AB-hydrolase YheT [Sistotremastrum suecicum HHB10207 ss-3]
MGWFTSNDYIPKIYTPEKAISLQVKSEGSQETKSLTLRQFVEANCPSLLAEYRPAWWLHSGHLQTVYCVTGDFSKIDTVQYERVLLRVADGGTLGLDFTPLTKEKTLPDDTPIVVILHGLTGGSYESYVRSVLSIACAPKENGGLGYRGVVVNFRGCADVPVTSPRFYSAGTTEDCATALLYLSQKFPKARLVGVGFSLGANVMAKYLEEEGEMSRLASGCVLGCPWNLVKNSDHLEEGFFSRHVYSKAMARNLVALLSKNLDDLNKAGPSAITPHLSFLLSGKSMLLRDCDEHMVRLVGGPSPPFPFQTARAYYDWASTHKDLDKVRVPLLGINADDDPIVMDTPTDIHGEGWAAIAVTHGGGHLGWFEAGKTLGTVEKWIRKPILEWVRATAEDLVVGPSKAREVEVVDGFTREVGRIQIAYKVVGTGGTVDSSKSTAGGLLAGL